MNLTYVFVWYFFINMVSASINVEFLLRFLKRQAEDIKRSVGPGTECYKQIDIFQKDLENLKVWPIAMLDASGKLESGLMQGSVIMFGNYDECLGIEEHINDSYIQGKYCTAEVTPNTNAFQCVLSDPRMECLSEDFLGVLKSSHIKWGICALDACSRNQLQAMWDFIENRYQVKFHLTFKGDVCFSKNKTIEYSTVSLVVWSIFIVLTVVCFASTMYDIFTRCCCTVLTERKYNMWMSFSIYTNTKKLLSNREDSSKVTCIYGIRVISMAWVVLGHTYYAQIQLVASNNTYLLQWLREDWSMFIMGALTGVDTYLVLSGFLIVYVTGIAKEKETPVHMLVFYGHRILRLTPAFAAVILIHVGIIPYLGNGPLWGEMDRIFTQPCLNNWWASILYIQNYYKPGAQCLIHGWYLSVDTQLYILSPILLLLLLKRPKAGLIIVVVLICACIALNIKTTVDYNIESVTIRNMTNFLLKIYFPTHLRASPWLIGIIFGQIMIQYKDKKICINKILVVIYWILTLTVMLFICYCYIILTKHGASLIPISAFNGLSHVVWAICICWVIFACSKGYGGCINQFLSMSLFRVLSRITYGIFLIHITVIWFLLFRRRTHTYAENLTQLHEFWGNYMFSVVLGYIWTLIFESPVAVLESTAIKKADVWIKKLSPSLLLK